MLHRNVDYRSHTVSYPKRYSSILHRHSFVPELDSRGYQIISVAVGLERGPLSLVRINEELLERKVAAPV
jgi:hypothetical protein